MPRKEVADFSQVVSIITALPRLRNLIISGRPTSKPSRAVEELLQHIGGLKELEFLFLNHMLLSEIPPGIRELRNLRSLVLQSLGRQEIPDWISELSGLVSLWLNEMELKTLPASLASLHELQFLSAEKNAFSEVPAVIFQLPSLLSLDIAAKDGEGIIKEIPAKILNLENLSVLDTGNQPIETPPAEVVAQGVEAIKNYWRQRQEAGVDYLCEAKLLIVGEGGAGKDYARAKTSRPELRAQP